MAEVVFYDIAPVPAPRQVRKDTWKPSKAVQNYRAFRDLVGWRQVYLPRPFFHVVFLFATPRSWTKRKTQERIGQLHEQTPDTDNLVKALVDGVYRNADDAHVANYAATKLWAGMSGILISPTYLGLTQFPVDLENLVSLADRR